MTVVRVHLLAKRVNLQEIGGSGYASKTVDNEMDI
jgi:hypothetical protein